MSLWCGACREEVFAGFGLLYRMEIAEGALRLPTEDKKYVPPNSAICDKCWAQVPVRFQLEEHASATASDGAHVYAFRKADSSNSPIWGSKQWSDIMADGKYVFVAEDVVLKYLEMAIAIIASVERMHAAKAKSVA